MLTIPNNHNENCGPPPVINYDDCEFLSYFQTPYGDQWIAVRKRGPGQRALLYGGDLGWEYSVELSEALSELVLSMAEIGWIVACLDVVRLIDKAYASRKV